MGTVVSEEMELDEFLQTAESREMYKKYLAEKFNKPKDDDGKITSLESRKEKTVTLSTMAYIITMELCDWGMNLSDIIKYMADSKLPIRETWASLDDEDIEILWKSLSISQHNLEGLTRTVRTEALRRKAVKHKSTGT